MLLYIHAPCKEVCVSAMSSAHMPLPLRRETSADLRRKYWQVLVHLWRRRRRSAQPYELQGAARLAAGLPTHQRAGL